MGHRLASSKKELSPEAGEMWLRASHLSRKVTVVHLSCNTIAVCLVH